MPAVICDDFTADRDILLDYCARYAKENRQRITTLTFNDAGALLQSREFRTADVIFLDIYMDGSHNP